MSAPPSPLLDALRAAVGGQYDIERVLGTGGMGTVFLARDRTLDRPVAIKVIAPDLAASELFRQRFLSEARTVARLRHPNIVAVYTAGEADGVLWFIMEFVPGESLRDVLDREKKLPPERVRAVIGELARALDYAHKQGVVHRDIKPENILIDSETGAAKLTDFGVARAASAESDRMTGTGIVVGTPRYMSPEQAAGERTLDGRSDLYSLGLVAYEMLAGQPAFVGTTPASVIVKQMTEPPPPLEGKVEGVPEELETTILRSLEKDPSSRWPSGAEMAAALSDRTGAISVTTHPGAVRTQDAGRRTQAGGRRTRGKRYWIAFAAIVAVLIAMGTTWLATISGRPPRGVDPRKSVLVIPFTNSTGDPSLGWLRDASVNMLTLGLSQWNDLTVVDYEHTLDLLRDADLNDASSVGLNDARRLARKAGVWTVVLGQYTRTRDSLAVTARVYDVSTGKAIQQQAPLTAPAADDPRPLFDRLAARLLDLAGARDLRPDVTRTTTASLDAYRAYLDGVRLLNRWEIERADTAFARAIAADSTFALAYYRRALARGWRDASDTLHPKLAALAKQYGERLPPRERALVDAFVDFEHRDLDAAEQKYLALVRRDSGDAEAWYGLGDTYWHRGAESSGQKSIESDWTKSLRAFSRTLQLDSTFHLAYQHRIQTYQNAGNSNGRLILDGDSVRVLGTDALLKAFGEARLQQVRARARELAIEDAKRWVDADPDADRAYRSLSDAYTTAERYQDAIATLRQGMARPGARNGLFAYRIAALELQQLHVPEALAALRQALRDSPHDSLADQPPQTRFLVITSASTAAAAAGSPATMKQALDLAVSLDPQLPLFGRGLPPVQTRFFVEGVDAMQRVAMGITTPRERAILTAMIHYVDTLSAPGPNVAQLRQQMSVVPMLGYMAWRDTLFSSAFRRWTGSEGFRALEALERGDTAEAKTLAAKFTPPDTSSAASVRRSFAAISYGQTLAELGDARGAIAYYESVRAADLAGAQGTDPRWPLFARSYLIRGQLYEQLGDRAKAKENYQRFLDFWRDADPMLADQLKMARDGIARVSDAPKS